MLFTLDVLEQKYKTGNNDIACQFTAYLYKKFQRIRENFYLSNLHISLAHSRHSHLILQCTVIRTADYFTRRLTSS